MTVVRWARWLGRPPFYLPYPEQIPALTALLSSSSGPIQIPGDAAVFVTAADWHNLLSFALRALKDGRLELGQDSAARVSQEAAVRVLHARLLRQALPTIVRILRTRCGVTPVLLKGPGVADRYYADRTLRPFVDLDLIVPRDSLGAAADALRATGYEIEVEYRDGFTQRHGHDVHLVRRDSSQRIDLELHWRVGDDRATSVLDHAFLYTGSLPLEVEGEQVLVPRTARQLLVLGAHLLSDRVKRLSWVNDIQLVGRAANDEEWNQAFVDADQLGLLWILHRALDYARCHLGFDRSRPIPAGEPPPFGPLRAAEEIYGPAALHLGRLAGISWRERAGYLHAVLAPSRAGLERTVGADGAPAWRLAVRHLIRGLRLLRRFEE
ncbi:MAG: nucleotidyltransferase family protein [Pseudonocardiales bacterium]|nr:nucleotidyltransferase family protein [Pseudonocardiales bacterium]